MMSTRDIQLTRLVEWGIASRPLDHDAESGDGYVVKPMPGKALLAVVDGLGHGRDAAEAARIAIDTVCEYADDSIISIFSRCHERLKGTRGVVMSLAVINASDSTMTWAGVGNVEGVLLRRGSDSAISEKFLLQRSGVIGDRLPPVVASTKTIVDGDTVILSTDGIRTGFDGELNLRTARPQRIAEAILASHRRDHDDALVLVARYLGT
jgi:hypothetical protein